MFFSFLWLRLDLRRSHSAILFILKMSLGKTRTQTLSVLSNFVGLFFNAIIIDSQKFSPFA